MILIQLLPCLLKVPDQFFSFLSRKQCNRTIDSSLKLTIVGHLALSNWLSLCKHFITVLLLVYISQFVVYYSLLHSCFPHVHSSWFDSLDFFNWVSLNSLDFSFQMHARFTFNEGRFTPMKGKQNPGTQF